MLNILLTLPLNTNQLPRESRQRREGLPKNPQPHGKKEKPARKGTSGINTAKHAVDATQEPQHKIQLCWENKNRCLSWELHWAEADRDAPTLISAPALHKAHEQSPCTSCPQHKAPQELGLGQTGIPRQAPSHRLSCMQESPADKLQRHRDTN